MYTCMCTFIIYIYIIYNEYIYINLVGGFNPSEKYESQLGVFFPIYGKIKMFQTTNQKRICVHVCVCVCRTGVLPGEGGFKCAGPEFFACWYVGEKATWLTRLVSKTQNPKS